MFVEIRPKWDWKEKGHAQGLTFSFALKSDQNGIERCTQLYDWIDWILVEIRPKWDWKESSLLLQLQSLSCWNQTKMGLKDWNSVEKFGFNETLKSDQNGIESF